MGNERLLGGHSKKAVICKTRREALEGIKPANTLDFRLQICEKTHFLLFVNRHLWHFGHGISNKLHRTDLREADSMALQMSHKIKIVTSKDAHIRSQGILENTFQLLVKMNLTCSNRAEF